MRKRCFSFRFTEATDKQIRELAKRWKCTRTAAVENAIHLALASGILLAKPSSINTCEVKPRKAAKK